MGKRVRAARGRPVVSLSLPTVALALLDGIAAGWEVPRSAAVERLVREYLADIG